MRECTYHPGAGRGDRSPGADQGCSPSPQQHNPTWILLPRHLRMVGRRAGRDCQPGWQLGEQMVPSAGEHKPLPTRARSQGGGAAPHQHPEALLGQGTGSHTHHGTRNTGVLSTEGGRKAQSCACLHPCTATSCLSSLPASCTRGSVFGRALSHWHRSHLAATQAQAQLPAALPWSPPFSNLGTKLPCSRSWWSPDHFGCCLTSSPHPSRCASWYPT